MMIDETTVRGDARNRAKRSILGNTSGKQAGRTFGVDTPDPLQPIKRVARKLQSKPSDRSTHGARGSMSKNRSAKTMQRKFGMRQEDTQKLFKFIVENRNNIPIFTKLENKKVIKNIVEGLISVKMGGWSESKDSYVNKSGRTVTKNNWALLEDGYLSKDGKNHLKDDIEWLHQIRQALSV
jgi:hypothetical protein